MSVRGGDDRVEVQPLADRWQADLADWAIPDAILEQAPQSPWIHPVQMFTVDQDIPDSPSHACARQGLDAAVRNLGRGDVLDVGCGGGRAAMALVPPATHLVGVDHQPEMLQAFAAAAERRGVPHQEFLGDWPQIQEQVPMADVVVCHHVAYNVAQIVPFLRALDDHARHRVVLEVPVVHPLTHLNPLWKRIWDLDRPTGPTAQDVAAIASAMGLDPHLQTWVDPTWGSRVPLPQEERVRFARIRLCLAPDRDDEVAAALDALGAEQPREMATLWWDVPDVRGTSD